MISRLFEAGGKIRIPVDAGSKSREITSDSPLGATYRIEKREVHLIDGKAEVAAAPGSATTIKTSVFGQPVFGDLDGDGDEDAALFLVHKPGGSGTFKNG